MSRCTSPHSFSPDCGRVELVCGPMFAGKSTELLRRLRRFELAGKRCLIVKHAADAARSGDAEVTTHDDRKSSDAVAIPTGELLGVETRAHDVVGIDEGQFFGEEELVSFCNRAADEGAIVIVAALDGDFRRKPFPSIARLFCLAESVSKLCAVCYECGADAPFSKRIVADQSVELVGGAESYVASCRGCFGRALPLAVELNLDSAEAAEELNTSILTELGAEDDGVEEQTEPEELAASAAVATPSAPPQRQSSNPQADSPPSVTAVNAELFASLAGSSSRATPSASGRVRSFVQPRSSPNRPSSPASERSSSSATSPVEALRDQEQKRANSEARAGAGTPGFARRMRAL